jgi:hypothetical protein
MFQILPELQLLFPVESWGVFRRAAAFVGFGSALGLHAYSDRLEPKQWQLGNRRTDASEPTGTRDRMVEWEVVRGWRL